MPFKNSRIFLIGGVFFIAVIIALAAVAASGPRTPSGTFGKTVTIRIDSDVGVKSIYVTNANTNEHKTVLSTQLPFSFNVTIEQTVTFNVTAMTGYQFDSWMSNDGRFHDQNPYPLKVA